MAARLPAGATTTEHVTLHTAGWLGLTEDVSSGVAAICAWVGSPLQAGLDRVVDVDVQPSDGLWACLHF